MEYMIIVINATGIYLSVILLTRIFGKRSFSKMSSFDFAMTVAVGSIIATTVLSPSVSIWAGMIGLLAVYALQMSVSIARRLRWVQHLVDNSPLILMDGDHILQDNMRKARVSEGDLRSNLRKANVTRLSQIKAVVFETTGDISVLHGEEESSLDNWLMKDVKRK
jgi:uncharacterized membrane protein YcaP (DUF421 family)